MFPGPGAQIYRNEAGEPLGWDYPSYEPDWDDLREQDDYRDEEETDEEDLPSFAEAEEEAEALLPKEPMDMDLRSS
jgi:hypothetical protein